MKDHKVNCHGDFIPMTKEEIEKKKKDDGKLAKILFPKKKWTIEPEIIKPDISPAGERI